MDSTRQIRLFKDYNIYRAHKATEKVLNVGPIYICLNRAYEIFDIKPGTHLIEVTLSKTPMKGSKMFHYISQGYLERKKERIPIYTSTGRFLNSVHGLTYGSRFYVKIEPA